MVRRHHNGGPGVNHFQVICPDLLRNKMVHQTLSEVLSKDDRETPMNDIKLP